MPCLVFRLGKAKGLCETYKKEILRNGLRNGLCVSVLQLL